jgi:hypothetical protein
MFSGAVQRLNTTWLIENTLDVVDRRGGLLQLFRSKSERIYASRSVQTYVIGVKLYVMDVKTRLIGVKTCVIDVETYVIDVKTYVMVVKIYVIAVDTFRTPEEGAHVPNWSNGLIKPVDP